jgi:hypothetical protein
MVKEKTMMPKNGLYQLNAEEIASGLQVDGCPVVVKGAFQSENLILTLIG